MTDSADTAGFEAVPADAAQPVAASAGPSWPPDSALPGGGAATERPELLVGAAFAGGLVLAMILKRLAR